MPAVEDEISYAAQQRLVQALSDPRCYAHPVGEIQLLETHISWVVLTGEYAYKIKKRLDLGFLDYSTLARRRHFCEEELRLNRRTAPELYLEVVGIGGSPEAPSLGRGPAMEYAVKMRQFDQAQLLDVQLREGRVSPALIDTLAAGVARFHAEADTAPADGPLGSPERIHQPVAENFAQIRERLAPGEVQAELEQMERWSGERFAALQALLGRRLAEGHIRECHGDLHLGNIVLLEAGPRLFDGIEFNDNLRWIDTLSDSAFLIMDLADRGRPDLSHRLANAYLERCGDYTALALLPYYLAYRAMVRAKVAIIRREQAADPAQREALWREYGEYLALAGHCTEPRRPFLLLTHGLSGSGKTTLSQPLVEQWGAFRLRSDIERKRLFGLAAEADSGSAVAAGIYSAEAGERTYARLLELAEAVLGAGYPVVVDATFLRHAQRQPFMALAGRLGLPFAIACFEAPLAVLEARILARREAGHDASEADLAVLAHQRQSVEPLSEEELARSISLDTEREADGEGMLGKLAPLVDRG